MEGAVPRVDQRSFQASHIKLTPLRSRTARQSRVPPPLNFHFPARPPTERRDITTQHHWARSAFSQGESVLIYRRIKLQKDEAQAAHSDGKMGIKQLFQIIKEEAPEAIKEGDIKTHFGRKVAIVSYFFTAESSRCP